MKPKSKEHTFYNSFICSFKSRKMHYGIRSQWKVTLEKMEVVLGGDLREVSEVQVIFRFRIWMKFMKGRFTKMHWKVCLCYLHFSVCGFQDFKILIRNKFKASRKNTYGHFVHFSPYKKEYNQENHILWLLCTLQVKEQTLEISFKCYLQW